MSASIDEFSKQFFQEVLSQAEAEGLYAEDMFFDRFTEHLVEAGEITTADRADYRGRTGTGIRVDGYGGDPLDDDGALTLLVLDFKQSSDVGRLTATEMEAIFQRTRRFLQRALEPSWRNTLEETTPAFGLADLIASRWSEILKVRLLLLSNRQLSARIDGRAAEELDGRPITHSVWDIERLYRLAASAEARENIEIDLLEEFGTTLPLLRAHLNSDDYESYLAVLPGHMLASIYDRWGARLLEQNVRVYLQARGTVNKGIRTTLENDPQMFFAYNNGITATAHAVETETRDDELRLLRLHNLQIVNGGQTTASIHAASMKKVDLSQVFVQMKLSVVSSERLDDVVPRISEYANSQNRINAADFFANHPYHVRIEEFSRRLYAPSPDGTFRETRWFYERARGQYVNARNPLTQAEKRKFDIEHPSAQRFSKTDLAKFLNVWEGKPHTVSLGAQKNFADFARHISKSWEQQPDDFNEAYFREVVAKAIVFRSAEKLMSRQTWYENGYRPNLVAHTISKFAYEVEACNGAVDFQAVWRQQSISQAMEDALVRIAQKVNQVLRNPPSGFRNITEWAKKQACWENVKALETPLPQEFKKELLVPEDIREQKRDARSDQKMLNGIEAQTFVVQSGSEYWNRLRQKASGKNLLSKKEDGVLSVAVGLPRRIPSEKQCLVLVELRTRLALEGVTA